MFYNVPTSINNRKLVLIICCWFFFFFFGAVERESAVVLFSHFYMGNKMNLINTVTCGGFCMMNSFILHKEFFT